MSAVFDVAPEHLVARARLELLFDPGTSARPARWSATACCRAPAASTGASSAPGRRTARFKGGSLGVRGGETIARTIEHADKLGVAGRRLPALRRRAPAGGRRRAARLQRDLPRAGPGHGAADQRDRRPVRRRRGVLAGARRPHGHGRPRREDVPHRPGRGRARHARAGHRARARRPEGPRAQRRRAPLRRARRARGRAGPRRAGPPALARRAAGCRSTRRPTRPRATPARSCPRASARSTTCATSPRG